ncbi:MAG: galactokinase [Ruminococcaceae bacterium]|nr:galactokinase [Oscillospiraceae bacterium]
MNTNQLKESILAGKYDGMFSKLYKDTLAARERYAAACDEFVKLYGVREDMRLFSAPGRTEVGGNHTDHQHGRVLAGSVDLDVIAIVSPNTENIVHIKSAGYEMDTVNLDNLEIDDAETGRAISLIRGMCSIFKSNGYEIGGFDAYTTSNVLKGSGLSSSAAFEVLIGNILSGMFNGGQVDRIEIAKIAQKAESVFFGKPCGLLDQSASSLGGFTAIDFKDPKAPVVEQVDFDLAEHGYALCVVNTGGNHANLTQDYADITVECRNISNFFGKGFLRDVEPIDFFENIAKLREEYGDRAVLRALHFFNEDNRAEFEKEALKKDDFNEFLRLVNESGNSSFKYLQNVYSTSNLYEQGIALALAITEQFFKGTGKGAYRVHGGGFAGTIQCFIPTDMLDDYKTVIEKVFGEDSCYILLIRPIGGCEIK